MKTSTTTSVMHTPGPWYADIDGCIYRRPPSELYKNGGDVAGDMALAVANKGWHHEGAIGYPVAENARLIAAAPELLEACNLMLREFSQKFNVKKDFHKMVAFEAARKAVAKATGEQP